MESSGPEVRLEKEEARAGETPHVVRYVLVISLALVIVAMGAIWLFGAARAPDNTGADADTARAVQETNQQQKAQP